MQTPKKLIDKIVFDNYIFKDLEQAQEYIRKHGTADYIAIAEILYTMEEYDMEGKYVSYYNKRNDNRLEVITENRYKNGFGDAVLYLYKKYGAYRNDISLAD